MSQISNYRGRTYFLRYVFSAISWNQLVHIGYYDEAVIPSFYEAIETVLLVLIKLYFLAYLSEIKDQRRV